MSLNSDVYRVIDSRLNASSENDIKIVVKEGAMTTNYTPLPAGSYSNSGITWNLNNIGAKIARDPRLAMAITVVSTLNVTNPTGADIQLINGDNFGKKIWAINRNFSTNHQINGATETLNTYDIIDYISRKNIMSEDLNFWENTQPDLISNYAAATGSNLNPLQSYSSTFQGDGIFKPRSLNYTVTSTVGGVTTNNSSRVPAGGSATIVITSTHYEPLISPFCNISSRNSRGLYGITGEIITVTLQPNLFDNTYAFTVPVGLTVNSAVSDWTTVKPILYTILLTPYKDMQDELPHESVYEYNKFKVDTSDIIAVNAGVSISSVSSVVSQYDVIPVDIGVYIRTRNNYRFYNVPDKYLNYVNATFTMNNGNPQLAGATPDQVYDISYRNSLRMPRACWKQSVLNYSLTLPPANAAPLYGCGSVVVLDPSLDLNLQRGLMVGSQGKFTFQMTNATFANNTADNFGPCTLYTVAVQKAVLKRVGLDYQCSLLKLPDNVAADAMRLPAIMYDEYMHSLRRNSFLGGSLGSFGSNLWKHLKKVGKYLWQNTDKVKDAGQKIYETGRDIYRDYNKDDDKDNAKGSGRMRRRKMKGGRMEEGIDLFYE